MTNVSLPSQGHNDELKNKSKIITDNKLRLLLLYFKIILLKIVESMSLLITHSL